MYVQPDPTYAALFTRADHDRTLRSAERYEVQRALREARALARQRRKEARRSRTTHWFRPRTGHRRTAPRLTRSVPHHL